MPERPVNFESVLLKEFRDKLSSSSAVGPFMKTTDRAFVEIMGYSGFDFCILDMEHGLLGFQSLPDLIRAALVSGILPVVRIPVLAEEYISKALDAGAMGIQVPQVSCLSDVNDVLLFAKFSPQGNRGVCRYVRAAKYSAIQKERYFELANQPLVIVQVEGVKGVANIDEIMQVEGCDVIFIGPYDLSQSLGVIGDTRNPKVVEAISQIVERAKISKKAVGVFVESIDEANFWIHKGVSYIAYSVDVGIVLTACKNIVQNIDTGKNQYDRVPIRKSTI